MNVKEHACALFKPHIKVPTAYKTRLNTLHDTKLSICSNFRSRRYFPSSASIRKERERHTQNPRYKRIIHPFSKFSMIENVVACIAWVLLLLSEAYIGTFSGPSFYKTGPRTTPLSDSVLLSLNLVLFADYCMRFAFGYTIEKVGTVVLEPASIVKHYLKTYCLFDGIPILNVFLFYILPLSPKVKLFIFQLHKLRLARMKTFFIDVELYLMQLRVHSTVRTVCAFAIIVGVFLHEWTCVVGLVNLGKCMYDLPLHRSWLHQYNYGRNASFQGHIAFEFKEDLPYWHSMWLYLVHFAVVAAFSYGCVPDDHYVQNSFERFIFSLILFTGMFVYVYTIAHVVQLLGTHKVSETKFDEIYFGLEDFMRLKQFPRDLQKRALKYYECKYQRKFFSKEKIFSYLSEHLRMEALLYSRRNLIARVNMFQGLSKSVIGCILGQLQYEIYLAGDVVLRTEDANDEGTYFIKYGTCGVCLPSGREIHHVEDGSHFGKNDSYVEGAQVHFLGSVVALEVSEVYRLEKKDIKHCCRVYPELVERLQRIKLDRSAFYSRMLATVQREEQVTEDIREQLRQGKILEKGLKRRDFGYF
ncbi:uncharacterized protein LOC135139917 [Zophobas morio]|uniref:uncharacterized protein LOC135139917 n=1 Tax=Zophobas morio TaxID=2755281 RepID=UPI0030837F2E